MSEVSITKEEIIRRLKEMGVLPGTWTEDKLIPHIGTKFYGFCNGYFDDDYGEKVVEAIGHDWIVVRNENETPLLAEFTPRTVFQELEMIREWMKKEGY